MDDKKLLNKKTRELSKALCQVLDEGKMRVFLEDLCTPSELESMADRWSIALLLQEGCSYRDIAEKLQTSTATISRVARSLKYGKGYKSVLEGEL